ncbi:MAG: helix-turn-helix domain-containing protein [Limisphaerales bacterium]
MSTAPMSDTHQQIFGKRLAQGRKMRGLSLQALADELGGIITKQALNKYEQGLMMPNSDVLTALADKLGLSLDFFFRPFGAEISQIEFRKRTKLTVKEEESIRQKAADFLERYLELEELVAVKSEFIHPLKHRHIKSADDVEKAASALRAEWQIGTDAIPNVMEFLEDKHIKVCELEAPESFDGFSGWADGVPIIVLNAKFNANVPRKRWTALHELGHLILDFSQARADSKQVERYCHQFAGAVLMPKPVFESEFGGKRTNVTLQELVDIKENYGISIAAVMARARTLGFISEGLYKKFCIVSSQENWRAHEPGEYKGSEVSKRFDQLLYRAVAEEYVTLSKAANLKEQSLEQFRQSLELVA